MKTLCEHASLRRGRKYRSSPTCASPSNALWPWGKRWEPWFCRNERSGLTLPSCQTERRMASWTCILSQRGSLARPSLPCSTIVRPKNADGALQLCLPRKSPALLQPVRCKLFTTAATQVPHFKVPKCTKPSPTQLASSGRVGCSPAATARSTGKRRE